MDLGGGPEGCRELTVEREGDWSLTVPQEEGQEVAVALEDSSPGREGDGAGLVRRVCLACAKEGVPTGLPRLALEARI